MWILFANGLFSSLLTPTSVLNDKESRVHLYGYAMPYVQAHFIPSTNNQRLATLPEYLCAVHHSEVGLKKVAHEGPESRLGSLG